MLTERGVGKPWTPEEDKLLTQAVAIHGEVDNWKTVALSIPGRTNKACRKRWLHSLSPNVKKTAWTADEDRLLLSLYGIHGTKWAVIARNIPGRTDDACSKRYREALDPSLKRDEWTSGEDDKLLDAYARLGGKWGLIGQELNRSGLACRNRQVAGVLAWRMMERKRTAGARQTPVASSSATAPTAGESQQVQSLQWQAEVDQNASPFWDAPMVPPTLAPAQFPVSVAHGNDCAEFFCACALHGEGSTIAGDQFDGSSFQYNPLSLPLPQQVRPADGPQPQTSYNYDPTQFPSDLNAAFDTPIQPETQRPSLALGNQSNTFYDMPFPADPGGNSGVVPSEEQVRPNDESFHQARPDGDSSASEGMAVDVPDSEVLQDTTGPELSGSTPSGSPPYLSSPPHVQSEETGTQLAMEEPTSYYRTPAEKARKASSSSRHVIRQGPPPRLSSTLPATTDSSVLAYACGHPDCWPESSSSSKACYATSKEVSDHSKAQHAADLGGSTPFRCGLPGCKKSWKSINGLQYHLQVSKAHFRQALALSQSAGPTEGDSSTPVSVPSDEIRGKPRKTYPCPHPGCLNQYKQLSGLRYHLAHGHPAEQPVQLDTVPPSLARKMAEKKQRRDSSAAG
ncbi:hypothetical protein DAEQUDRAFT_768737 [Daedalea quercina L-15889]|uniref:C2H2-type domain-containing protein n=1 Tax=Daedalea quercina L-15889 TaxID=1314783 RepID=A0A165MEA1_9APHY|nr:hypothetical protein DAEQUDRAFT_768737 [Daedalea quercina L-15889]